MAAVSEYRKFADECLRWAAEAKSEDERDSFLGLARDWTLAALRLEGTLTHDSHAVSLGGPFSAEHSKN